MNWLIRLAKSDTERIKSNIMRLESLRSQVHDLANFAMASNGGAFAALSQLVEDNVVLGRPLVKAKLEEALIGENRQKIALDSPVRFQRILYESENLIAKEISIERTKLKELELDNERG